MIPAAHISPTPRLRSIASVWRGRSETLRADVKCIVARKAGSQRFPFPFVGAGNARYFEWAEILVRFVAAPTKSTRAAIETGVPSPLGMIEWKKDLLVVSSQQFVQCDITAAFGSGTKPRRRTRRHLASSEAVDAFNAEIEEWLRAADALAPVLVAYRRRDAEAGGTDLSRWHTWSLKQAATFMPAFAAAVRSKRESPARLMAKGILLELLDENPRHPLNDSERALVGPLPGASDGMQDVLAELNELGRTLTSHREPFSDGVAETVVELVRPWFPLDPSLDALLSDEALGLYLAYHAATVRRELALARHIASDIRRLEPNPGVRVLYVDFVRGAPNPKLTKLADEVLQPDADDFRAASARCSDPAEALMLLELAASRGEPSADVVRDALAALLAGERGPTPQTVEEMASRQPGELDPRTARRWLRRASGLTDPSCRLNVGWLLARLGKSKRAAVTLAEAIRDGADAFCVCAGQAVAGEHVWWGRPWGNAYWVRAVPDQALAELLTCPEVCSALADARGNAGQKKLREGARLASLGEQDAALDTLIEAIDEGVEVLVIKESLAFVPLRSHKRWRSIRNRPKKRRATKQK